MASNNVANMQFISSPNFSNNLDGDIGQQPTRAISETGLPKTASKSTANAPGSTTINIGATSADAGAMPHFAEVVSTLDEPV